MSRVFQALGIATATLDLGIAGKIALRYHVYRVVVEKARHQTVVVEATSQDEAEDKAYDIAEHRPEGWVDGDMELRDCTSVRMADGSWEFCSALEEG